MDTASLEVWDGSAIESVMESIEYSDEEEDEPTALEYARQNQLSCDHLTDYREIEHHLDTIKDTIDEHLMDESCLPPLDFGPLPRLEERPFLSKEAAIILQSVAQGESLEALDAITNGLLDSRKIKYLRVELPLLKSDHQSDCQDFAKWKDVDIKLEGIKLPLEEVDEENFEGLAIPSKYCEVNVQAMQQIQQEKIEVTKEAMLYLQDALKASWTAEDQENLWNDSDRYKKTKALEPVTPPLLPISPPPSRYEPSAASPEFNLPLLPEPKCLFESDLDAMEENIMEQDVPTPIREFRAAEAANKELHSSSSPTKEDVSIEDYLHDHAFLENDTLEALSPKRFKRDDYKVEEILIPLEPPVILPKVRFSQEIEVMLLEDDLSLPNSQEIEKVLEANFGAALEETTRKSQQEQLIAADNLGRVEVRIMPEIKPECPWAKLRQCQKPAHLLSLQKEMIVSILGQNLKSWAKKQNPADLQWAPFPTSKAKLELEEDYPDDDNSWKAIIGFDDVTMDSSDLTWKPPGLRILKIDPNDDDEIEKGELREPQRDMSFLVKKRKKELEQEDVDRDERNRELLAWQASKSITKKNVGLLEIRNTPKQTDFMSATHKLKADETIMPNMLLSGAFSAANYVGNFMELRGIKKPKLINSGHFSKITVQPPPQLSLEPPTNVQRDMTQLPIRQSPTLRVSLPAPGFTPSEDPTSIIVSTTLLRHRGLIRHLETHLKSLTMIERDFTAHNTTAWMPGSVVRSPITSPMDSEADIIISPKVGIVLTTLQKVKQQPLPGQKGKSAIQNRVAKASLRYDKLVVLVTEGRKDEATNGLDENDCLALTAFIGFTSGLATSTTVQYIAGGEETLANWIASTVAQHRLDANLLEDETYWELFLRRAGMNAFAAQQVVAVLKAPEGVDPTSPTKAGMYGLTSFVEMSREQRIDRLGLVCGNGVLGRVSDVVDQRWE